MKHLAIVMDGNRRWAKRHKLEPWYGHREGAKSIETAIKFCLENKILYLSLYTFSLENFKRSETERFYLFDLISNEAEQQLPLFMKHGIRIRFIGDRTKFPASVIPAISMLEHETAEFRTLTINFLFCYGGRQEIVSGIQSILQKIRAGEISEDQLDEGIVAQHLWTNGTPEPDLIIRTGGVRRLSNFLVYQGAYSELCFLDCMWPDLSEAHLLQAMLEYQSTARNFGT